MLERLVRRYSTTREHTSGPLFSFENRKEAARTRIPWGNYVPFWNEYCRALTDNEDAFASSQLYEYNPEEMSARFTFVFSFVHRESVIEDSEIGNVLEIIRESIFDTLQLVSDEAIACVSMGKSDTKYILDYIFPSVRINKGYLNDKIIPDLCNRLHENKIRQYLPEFRGGDWNEIIRRLSDFSPVYGCKVSQDDPTLKFYGLWSSTDMKLGDDINDSFTATRHSWIVSYCSRDVSKIDEDSYNYTPIILSSRFAQELTMPKIEETLSRHTYHTDISSATEYDMVYHLTPLIGKERYNNPMYRWQIGRCIYNIFNKDRSGLDFFNEQGPGNEKENEIFWEEYSTDTGINDYLSIRTIGYFAKLDNKDQYEEWHNNWIRDAVIQSLDKIELNVAEVMYRLLWLEFLTVGKNDWYRFDPTKTKLIKSISNVDFTRRFGDMISFYSKIMAEGAKTLEASADHTGSAKDMTEKFKGIAEIMKKLGTRGYQKSIESHCFAKFHRDRIDEYFDSNPNLMAWGNVVTEVHNDDIYPRPGKMEDFITMSSDIDYNDSDYHWEHPKIKELLYWFETAFVGEGLVDYFLKICSSFLYGRNVEKVVYAFCGPSGNNSKSMIKKLREGVFGVYNVDFPVSVLTDASQSRSGPCPEIAQAKGARSADIAEPDGNIPFMGSLIKRYSGGDKIFARKLHENGSSFDPMFKMILYCNAVPPIEEADDAVERRIVVLPFLSRYCIDAPTDVESQFAQRKFPMDPHFDKKIEHFRKPMLWVMINYFNKYRTEGIIMPQIVKDYTEKYWLENDPYKLFMTECLARTQSPGDRVTVSNVHKKFKVWYAANFSAKRNAIPNLTTMGRHLSSQNFMGEPKNRAWSGWKMVDDMDSGRDPNGSRKHSGIE